MALFLSVEPGDSVRIGDSVISFEKKSGRQVRVRIDSKLDIEHVGGQGDKPATPVPAREAPAEQPRNGVQPVSLSRPLLSPQP